MTYAQVTNGTITTEGGLPPSARRLDTQEWVMGLPDAAAALQQACGWYQVAITPRPADTPTQTSNRAVTLVNGVPTEQWTMRAKTAGELAADTAGTNGTSLRAKALQAVTDNLTSLTAVTQGHAALATTATNSATIKGTAGGTLAVVNGKINAVCDELTRLASVVDAMLTQEDRIMRQLTTLELLTLGKLDDITGT